MYPTIASLGIPTNRTLAKIQPAGTETLAFVDLDNALCLELIILTTNEIQLDLGEELKNGFQFATKIQH